MYTGAIGAGPGPTTTYYVDLPLPWGRNTEITLPMQQLVADAVAEARPALQGDVMQAMGVIAATIVVAVAGAAWLMTRKR